MKAFGFSLKYLGITLLALTLILGFGWNTAEANNGKVEVLIGFEGKPGPAEHRLIGSQGGKVTKELKRIDVLLVELPSHDSEWVINALRNVPKVSFVEENGIMEAHSQTVPWGIDRVFGDGSYSFPTWNASRGEGIGVAILDTGIYCDHPDLIVIGGTNTIDATGHCSDGSGHGTHVAGTVAALDNNLGVVGVAPDVDLYAVKVLDDGGGGTVASVVAGIEWAVDQDISIINMSLGGGHHQTLQLAIQDAYNEGVLLVASAGNSGPRPNSVSYPARYPEVIAVSATDINDGFPNFSSRGSQVELAAPGVSILSTLPANRYGYGSGTSMASPHVAGVAALVRATDPALSNVEIRKILQDTAEDIGLSSDRQGYGLVRADLAVAKALENQPDPIPDPDTDPEYGVEIIPTDGEQKTATPGYDVTYEFTIKNTGTEDDTYDISIDGNGWSATTSTSSVSIDAGGSVDITVTHSIPDSAGDDDSDTGTLIVSSDNATSTASFTTTVEKPAVPGDPIAMTATESATSAWWHNRNIWRADVTITVTYEYNSPVKGAEVKGVFGNNGSVVGVTNNDGEIILESGNFRQNVDQVMFKVESVILEGYYWDSYFEKIYIDRP